jgi:hypothetical protein
MTNGRKPLNPNRPIGFKASKGPAKTEAVKVTDNSNGWTQVANIPVPPEADKRNFNTPLGKAPILVNGGKLPEKPVTLDSAETNVLQNSFEPIKEEKPAKLQTVEINWYGAILALDCVNAIYQPGNYDKNIPGLLLLELPVLDKTKGPMWVPPVAQLDQNGKMHVPEFECIIQNQELRCQVLNIDIQDKANKKRVFVFRVLDFTE